MNQEGKSTPEHWPAENKSVRTEQEEILTEREKSLAGTESELGMVNSKQH
jgi:hypothetical protein